jgi:hypothetical protein
MEQVAWISVQATLAVAGGFVIATFARWLGYVPSYEDAPRFYGLCCFAGLVLVSAPVTFFVSTFAPILKEKQRAARRRRREQVNADFCHDLDCRRPERMLDRR